MRSQGDFAPGKTVRIFFNTRDTANAPITLAGTPAISIYKDSSTTESTAGVTLTVDFDGRTGLHLLAVDTSADGTFYAAGSDFKAVITAGTVATISVVGVCVGAFSLYNRSALRPATADRTLVVDSAGLADANVVKLGPSGSGTAQTARDVGASVLISPGSGAGQLDVTSGVIKSNLAQILGTALTETSGLIAAAFKKFFNVATPTGNVNSLPDAVAGAPNGVSIVGSVMGKSPATLAAGDVSGNLPADLQTIKTRAVTDPGAGVAIGTNVAQVGSNMGTVSSVTGNVAGSVASVTADVGITQAGADKVWGSATRTLTSFGTLVADIATAVWGAVARTLTAGTNIVLAKGTGVTGFNDIAAGAQMDLVNAPNATAIAAFRTAIAKTAMTESYAADGAAPTMEECLFLIQQVLTEFATSGVTLTVKKLDGATTAATFTFDDGTSPTSLTRTT